MVDILPKDLDDVLLICQVRRSGSGHGQDGGEDELKQTKQRGCSELLIIPGSTQLRYSINHEYSNNFAMYHN